MLRLCKGWQIDFIEYRTPGLMVEGEKASYIVSGGLK